ncbi:MAG: DUF2269 family protein [Egibacteraceae bacterium]
MNIYALFKFLHVVSVIVLVGGVFTLNVLSGRLARERDPAAVAALSRQATFYGRSVLGPATGITLIAGVATAAIGRISFATLWIAWGLLAILLSGILGGTAIRRAGEQLSELAATAEAGGPRVVALRRRALMLNWINLLLLLSAVGAMVFKPTL